MQLTWSQLYQAKYKPTTQAHPANIPMGIGLKAYLHGNDYCTNTKIERQYRPMEVFVLFDFESSETILAQLPFHIRGNLFPLGETRTNCLAK